jgi:crotonobetainyl-CoA:carnitine CoA-transferase CaiB-like acyl-CoA transferase
MNGYSKQMNDKRSPGRGPLEGIRVLDLTIAMAGPLCTQRLGEMGADIIKIEAPGGGDFSRKSPMAGITKFGDSTCFLTLNRNKRSVVLDLKSDAGRAVLHRMVKDADVLIQNFRPRVLTKLGIDYATLKAINPKLVYAGISGYGEEGPLKDRPGQDLLLQSFTGLTMNAGSASGLPHPSPLYMVDASASHLACEGILAALVARGRTGAGQEVKVSMIGAIMEMQIQELTSHLATDAPPRRSNSPAASIWMEPPYGIYACASGHIALAQGDLAVLGETIDVPALAQLKAARPAQADAAALGTWRDAIYDAVAAKLAIGSADHWDQILTEKGFWCGIVNDYDTFLAHPQTQSYLATISHPLGGDYITVAPAIRFSDDPSPDLRPAPRYGANTVEVLTTAGFSTDEIDELLARNVAIAG